MGFSAGGHLAGSASTLFDVDIPYIKSGSRMRPDFSILIYPVISMRDGLTHSGSKKALLGENPDPELVRLFSLENQVTPDTPPTFILHAGDDESVSVENTMYYAEALQKNKVPVKKIIVPHGGHGFGYRKESPAFNWTGYLSSWLKDLTCAER
jgi:acetyl esterase/lipase